MRALPCWKEWFPIFFSGARHFFSSHRQSCTGSVVATVSNHIQNKTKAVVDASAPPVAALLIQWEKGCDKGRRLVMDVRTVVEVTGTSWCGTVPSRTLEDSHGHPRFSFLFPTDAVSLLLLLLPMSPPLTAAATGRDSSSTCRCCGCGCCLLLRLLLLLLLLLLLPLPLPRLCELLFFCCWRRWYRRRCLRRCCADAAAAFEIDEQCVWYCSSIVWLNCYCFL